MHTCAGESIKLSLQSHEKLTIIGVHLPSSDYSLDIFRADLGNNFFRNGPALIAGDFNAHLGNHSGQRGCGNENASFSMGSSTCESLPSSYTHPHHSHVHLFPCWNFTTVEYCLIDHSLAYATSYCKVHEEHPLNLSDHLPISLSLSLDLSNSCTSQSLQSQPNWRKAASIGSLEPYQSHSYTRTTHAHYASRQGLWRQVPVYRTVYTMRLNGT